MKLYHFNSPENYYFAQASRRGTWFPKGARICPECNTTNQKRISPLIIEWEPGSDVIGDFVWPGLNTDLVVTQRVRSDFQGRFYDIEFGPVEFWQSPRLKPSAKMTKRSMQRVWLPYTGPVLWDVIPIKWCRLNHRQSNITIDKVCSTCGKTIYKTPPYSQRHLVVDRDTWNREDIFHIHEYSGAIYCTEMIKEFVEQNRYTNVSFLEDGEIPD